MMYAARKCSQRSRPNREVKCSGASHVPLKRDGLARIRP